MPWNGGRACKIRFALKNAWIAQRHDSSVIIIDATDEDIPARLAVICQRLLTYHRGNRRRTFGQLASALKYDTGLRWRMPVLFEALTLVNGTCFHVTNQHLVSACIVTRDGFPGSGFFAQATDLGLLPHNADGVAKARFWLAEIEALKAFAESDAAATAMEL